MTAFRNIVMLVVFVIGSVPLLVVGATLSPVSTTIVKRIAQLWSGLFIWCARTFAGVRLVIRGELPNHGCILAWKHQSAFETMALLRLLDQPATVMKASLRDIPLWGYVAMRHGSIFVDRDKGGVALRAMLRQAKVAIAAGRPVLIFPEGTRVAVGETPALKPGLAMLYEALKVEVVPVALDSGVVWRQGDRWLRPGVVTFSVQPPVPAGLPRAQAVARVHAAINADPTA